MNDFPLALSPMLSTAPIGTLLQRRIYDVHRTPAQAGAQPFHIKSGEASNICIWPVWTPAFAGKRHISVCNHNHLFEPL